MTVGKLIKKLREEKDYSQRQLALYSKVSNTEISKIESGERQNPNPEILKKIANALRIDYMELFQAAGYVDNTNTNKPEPTPEEKYSDVTDVEEAMEILLNQPGLMLKGEALEDEDKIILANAIQAGLRMADEIRKKRREQEGKDGEQYQ